ncbi:MAG: DUF927 domain-containing protein [Pseudomonadota bacterium]|nr:DUF927 domain-containing protein [Pseudomonadota bacterium]
MKNRNSNSKPVKIKLLAIGKNTVNDIAYRYIKYRDHNGKIKSLLIPSTTIFNLNKLRDLFVNKGYSVVAEKEHWKQVQDALLKPTKQRIYISYKPGFVGNSYLCADNTVIGPESKHGPILSPDSKLQLPIESIKGEHDKWQAFVEKVQPHSPVLTCTLCTAFAGFITKLMNMDSGGFHIFGTSSMGKSTSLRFAASIFGSPLFVQSWDMTDKALEESAEGHNDSTLMLDELKLIHEDPKIAAKMATKRVYQLAEGKGKARCVNYQGASSEWNLAFLSAGELSLSRHASDGQSSRFEGEAVRIIDVPADTNSRHGIFKSLPSGFNSAQEVLEYINTNVSENHGTAKGKFLERLTAELANDKSAVLEFLDEKMSDFLSNVNSQKLNGQHYRIARRFGLSYAAGCLAKEYGVLSLSKHGALLRKCYISAIESIPVSPEQLIDAKCDHVLKILDEQQFDMLSSYDREAPELYTVNGFRKVIKGRNCILVRKEFMHTLINDPFFQDSVLDKLSSTGYLYKDSQGKRTRSIKLPDENKERFYCIITDLE